MDSSRTNADRIFRFGQFELSERGGELRKNGARIKLQDQPFRVLVELVASAGRVVTREQLQQRLWPADTFVDFDVGFEYCHPQVASGVGRRRRQLALHRDLGEAGLQVPRTGEHHPSCVRQREGNANRAAPPPSECST